MKLISSLIFFLFLCQCASVTVTYDDSVSQKQFDESQFHHIWLLSFIEQSPPVKLDSKCPSGWTSFRTRMGPIQSLIRTFIGGVYDPEEVSYSCGINEDKQ